MPPLLEGEPVLSMYPRSGFYCHPFRVERASASLVRREPPGLMTVTL
jgi:hypothetical protein